MAFEKENMEVKILSTKFIKPSSPTPNHLQNYKLSFFDQIADEAHLPLVLFYPPTNDTNTYNEEQLEQSLSRILTHVYPIAGRFAEEEKIDFLRFNLADVFPPRDLSKLLLPRLPQDNRKDTKLVAKRLYIDEDSISSLRKEVGDLCFKPSRVEMIIALLWRALIRASEKKHGHLRRSLIGVPINLRPKLISLPQVEKSFGNLVIDAPVKFIPGENKMELHNFVTLIRDTVKETIIACDKTSTEDVVSAVANIYNASFVAQEWGGNEEVDMYTSSSLCRFPIQEADFGWGKPCLMHFGSRHNQYCWLYDAECGNGICVQADLKETNMHLFERDSDIKAFFEF